MNASDLKKEILKDGTISGEGIVLLRTFLFEDGGGMDRVKGNFLFDLKKSISPNKRTEIFKAIFIEAITILLLEDEVSPGEIDESEAKWLRAKIQIEGSRDDLNIRLLEKLKERIINFPEILNYKGKTAVFFENCLYLSRFLTIFAVIGSILASVVLFIKGTIAVSQGLILFVTSFKLSEVGDYELLLENFVSAIDIYLFATVLIIFGVGIYELFINKIDPVERKVEVRPSWLQVSSIDDLKSSLGKVILMILIVSFFKHSLEIGITSAKDLLLLAVGVVLIAASLFIANYHHKQK